MGLLYHARCAPGEGRQIPAPLRGRRPPAAGVGRPARSSMRGRARFRLGGAARCGLQASACAGRGRPLALYMRPASDLHRVQAPALPRPIRPQGVPGRRGGRLDPPPGEPATASAVHRAPRAQARADSVGTSGMRAASAPAGSGMRAGAAPASGCGAARSRRRQPPIPCNRPVPHGKRAVDPAGQISSRAGAAGDGAAPASPARNRCESSPAIPARRRRAPGGPHPRPPDPRGSSCRRPRRPSPWPEGGGALSCRCASLGAFLPRAPP